MKIKWIFVWLAPVLLVIKRWLRKEKNPKRLFLKNEAIYLKTNLKHSFFKRQQVHVLLKKHTYTFVDIYITQNL